MVMMRERKEFGFLGSSCKIRPNNNATSIRNIEFEENAINRHHTTRLTHKIKKKNSKSSSSS